MRRPCRLEVVAQAQVGTLWSLSSGLTLAEVLKPGFFDRFEGYQLRLGDRINACASFGTPEMSFASLAVTRVGDKRGTGVEVTQLAGGAL